MAFKRSSSFTRTLRAACAILAITLGATPVLAAKENLLEDGSYMHRADPVLMLTIGKAEIITVPGEISDILVADPEIADVVALKSDKLYIVGSNLGDTNIIATDREGNVLKRLNVNVNVDTVAIEELVHRIFPKEENVQVHMIGDQVALTGLVSTPTASQKIARLVAAHMGEIQEKDVKDVDELIENLMEVRGEQQVMLRVRMLEMNRGVLKELGLESNVNDYSVGTDADATNGNGLTGFLGAIGRTALTKDPLGVGGIILDTGLAGIGEIEFLVNALQNDNLANMLAEPNLTSVSGEQAGFLAGGEFPVPVGRDREGNIIIEYKEFGVSLNFKPIVLSEDRISLQMNTEVSALDPAQGLTLADIQIPGLDVRRASTTVEINSGGTLMMAGLLKSESVKGMAGIPGIKDTPVLGDLLSSDSFSRDETELVVLVTPYLVQPFADDKQAVAVRPQPSAPASLIAPIDESKLQDPLPPPPPKGLAAPAKENPKPKQKTPEEHSALPPGFTEDDIETQVHVKLAPKKAMAANTPLNKAFSKNMNDVSGGKVGDLSAEKQSYGYMLE